MRPGRFGAVLVVAGVVMVGVSLGGCSPCSSKPGGCEAQTTVAQRSAIASDDVVCRDEALTGSHIVETRCYRRQDIREREAKDRAFIDRLIIQANRPMPNPATGKPNPR